MRHLFLLIISTFSFSQEIYKDSIQLYYPTAEYSLNETHKNELTAFHSAKSTDSIQNITVTGYTDFVGNSSYNTNLAEKRIQNVIEFLNLKHSGNINKINIGELNKPDGSSIENGVQEHRKTNISYSYIKKPKPTKYTYLQQIDSLNVGDKIRLRNINFLLATARLTKKSIPELDNLFNILNRNKNLHIEIEGHVCCGGKGEVINQNMTYENEWLSSLRAKTIYDYLTDKGIDSLRLRHKGYGFTKPLIYPEETESDRYRNRRIELSIISNNHLDELKNIELGESIILRNISYEWGKAEPKPESYPEIMNLFNTLDKYSNLEIEIQGHVCCGKKEYTTGEKKSHHNYLLSNNRAKNIEKKLINLGIDPIRMSHRGLGFSQPKIYPEKTSADKELNRRIEIVLRKK